jgi:hypothetical protein
MLAAAGQQVEKAPAEKPGHVPEILYICGCRGAVQFIFHFQWLTLYDS